MQMSRPSLAFAGSAAVVVVAGVVSYQILVTPQPLQPAGSVEIERRLPAGDPASIDRTNTADELADAAALPQPAGLAEIERRLPAGDPASIDRTNTADELADAAALPQPAGLAEIERRLPAGDPASIDRTNTADELADDAALPQPAGLAEIERRLPARGPASIDRTNTADELADDAALPQPVRLAEIERRLPARGPASIDRTNTVDELVDDAALLQLAELVEGLTAGVPATASIRGESTVRVVESDASHYRGQGRDRFTDFDSNPVKVAAEEPVSTFSIDVDTASYGFMRASLNEGMLPEKDAVRIEELINYFPYDYAPPEAPDTPFAAHVSVMPAPWNDVARLMHIGIKGYVPDRRAAPRANLVFLIDTSGSMDAPNKLPLLINSLKLLLDALTPEDRVAIVTYAGSAGVVLAPTQVAERARIRASLERLRARGSTAGAEGIREAYRLAEQHLVEDGINRVILATDGDFNVGITEPEELERYITRQRASGVFLSVLGFGMGNYNDALMQRLAQNGNGNAAYIDSLSEARKVLVEEATSTLFPIAKDVKIQVEFNPAAISEYRLIGYETRMLAREDFRNDKVDAGEIGAGHTVTAIYEVTPVGLGAERIAPLRYRREGTEPDTVFDGEFAFLKIRYKLPGSDTSTLITRPVNAADAFESVDSAPREARFAAAVAAFGELLRGGRYTGDYGYGDVIALAHGGRGEDPFGYRAEFIGLVRLAQSVAAMEPW